jgi:hypothetical protein
MGRAIAIAAFGVGVTAAPHRVCARSAERYFDGDADASAPLADAVDAWTHEGLGAARFHTGSDHYDREWLFGTYMMAAMGFGQRALAHPDHAPEEIARMERCLDALLTEDAKAFDTRTWELDPIASLSVPPGGIHDVGHVAYLGYLGLALELHRLLVPESRFEKLSDDIATVLARRIERSPLGFVETFPGATFPVDNFSALGALGLHARATGVSHRAALQKAIASARKHAVDPETGLLVQALRARDGKMMDVPRGSGTALGSYFISFVDPAFSRELYGAAKRHLYGTTLGFGAANEYPDGRSGRGDIDSGPIAFGLSVAATGFLLGAARTQGDRDTFRRLYATTHLFGLPVTREGRRGFVTGGPIGDAVIFAMVTAPPEAALAAQGARRQTPSRAKTARRGS